MQNINTSPSSKAPLSFFDLPQKLRDRVYVLVLETKVRPGRYPAMEKKDEEKVMARACAVQPRDIASFGLLYACRQSRYEMSHAIARQSATEKDITYQLDCLVTARGSVIPTWTALPAPPCHLRHMDVTVRAFHSASGDRLNAVLIPALLDLVTQFFEREYSWWGQSCYIPLIVDTLTVELPYPDDRLCARFLSQLAASGGLWKKIRRVRVPGLRQIREWVVLPSWSR
ncbi:hypothetical protein MMC22_009220 [Lobaria immixta]|nr:hypothetical protein [Lobaria immixta]